MIRYLDTVVTRKRVTLSEEDTPLSVSFPPLDQSADRYVAADLKISHVEGHTYDFILVTLLYPQDYLDERTAAAATARADYFEMAEQAIDLSDEGGGL